MRTVYLLIVACLQLEDQCLWLVDRLVDIALESLSTSLYRARNVQVTAILEDMVDFFTY